MTTLWQLTRELERTEFVGRGSALAWFTGWLDGDHRDVAVLNVVGHGGVGKSALLQRFAEVADDRGVPHLGLDGREMGPGRDGLLAALGAEELDAAVARLDRMSGVVLIDAFGATGGISHPLFDDLLPRLALPVRVVVASRHEALPASRSHPLRRAVRRLDLPPLGRGEVRDYLQQRGLDADTLLEPIWDLARGNPLATSMATDVAARPNIARLDAVSEWRRGLPGLTERLVSDLEPDLRELVEAAAVVRQFDQELLAALTAREVPPRDLEALARLSMVRASEHGMRLHDDVRQLIAQDLRRRRPEHAAAMRGRALRHYAQRMRVADRAQREWLVADRLYLWEHDVVRSSLFPDVPEGDEVVVEGARAVDRAAIEELWQRHGDAHNPSQGGAATDDVTAEEVADLVVHPASRWQVVRDAAGVPVAAGLEVRVAADSCEALPAPARHAVAALQASGLTLPPTAADSSVRYLGPIVAHPDATAAMGRLARWAIGSWIHGGVVVVGTTMAGYAGLMEALGFARLPVDAEVDGRPVHALVLHADAGDVEDWIRRVTEVAPPVGPAEPAAADAAIEVLGRFRVVRDGRDATPTGLAAQALKHVVVADGALHAEELAARLWPTAPGTTGRTRLRNVLSRLRDSSGEVLVRDGEMVTLAAGITVDAHELAQVVQRAAGAVREFPAEVQRQLEAALERWHGELLPGDVYVDEFTGTRERLRRLRITAHDLLATAARAMGDDHATIAALEHALDLDPYDEDRYVRAARVHLDAGRRGAARQVLRRARAADEELGVPPSPALLAMEEQLRR